ncbi:MAG: DUF4331 domain-containing protein [Planctomycetes bacterium]|nr:DUF4331 domain-containing protein [Planctomycetota bacterium]
MAGAIALPGTTAHGASPSDAPLIKQDPQANITDVYAFVGRKYDNPGQNVLNVIVQVRPFSEPGDGVIYDRFADDALYSIHITDPFDGSSALRYNFRFSSVSPRTTPGLKNPDTILSYGLGTEAGAILSIGDARQNYTQTYTVMKEQGGTTRIIGSGLPIPPPNLGARTTPAYNDAQTGAAVSGAIALDELDSYTRDAISDLNGGEASWAGPREDGFYADTPAIFDLLDPRIIEDKNGNPNDGLGQDGGGVDGFKGFNVLSYALQIPVQNLSGVPGFPFVGVYASVSRPRITLRLSGAAAINAGPWLQVNRMGNPLFNEVLVPLKDKDRYNRTSPVDDETSFATYALNPEVAFLINFVLFADPTGQSPIPTVGRSDLHSIYIPDVLRVATDTEPVRLAGQTGFNRLSFFGGDFTNAGFPSGWPNGRRLGDDVVDIALTAIASPAGVGGVGDNVNANDQVYNQVFPYAATPHAGTRNSKDGPCVP